MSIRQYSTTFLLLGSIASAAPVRAMSEFYSSSLNNEAFKQTMIAEFALADRDPVTAIHNYTVLAIRSNSPALKQRALDIALEYNDLASALNISRHWVAQEPEDVPALFYLAHISLKAHEYKLAAHTLDIILKIDPDADLEQILAGISPESKADRADLLLTLSHSRENKNPSVLAMIAGLEAQDGQLEQALQTINQALRKRPKVTGFILMKANLLMALGQLDEVEKWYKSASRRNPNNLEVHLAEARFLIKNSQPEKALEKLQLIIKKWPEAEDARFIAGLTSIDLKHYEQAEDYLISLRNSARYQNEAFYYLAINAERKQQYETAKAYYRMVDGSLYTVSRRSMIGIFQKQNQLGEALRFLTQERVNYPQHASFLYQLQADILKKKGNTKAAIRLLDEAIKNIPDDPELLYAEVLLLDANVDRTRLDQILTELLKLEPNNPTYLNAYAYTLALQNRRLDEAREYAELALEYAPEQASILDTLGYIAFLQNDFAAASEALGHAYLISNNINIGVRYAKSLYMQGNLKRFSQVLQQLKQKHPDASQLQQLDGLILPTT